MRSGCCAEIASLAMHETRTPPCEPFGGVVKDRGAVKGQLRAPPFANAGIERGGRSVV